MSDLIDRQVAIDELQKEINKVIPPFDGVTGAIRCGVRLARNIIEDLPSAQPEALTDDEQRIFLAAMAREKKICEKVDAEWSNENNNLVRICNAIERKVKAALWKI